MCEVVTESILEQVYFLIKRDITKGFYKSGDRLRTKALCDRYNVSDTPVKQALNRMITEGLVESIARKGLRVKIFSEEDLRDMIKTRKMIECYCIHDYVAMLHDTPQACEELSGVIHAHKNFIEQNMGHEMTPSEYLVHYSYDCKFHTVLVKSSNSHRITDIFDKLQSHIYMCQIYGKRGPNEALNSFVEHYEIFKHLMALDEESAQKALLSHFDSFLGDLQNIFSSKNMYRAEIVQKTE